MRKDGKSGYQALKDEITRKNKLLEEAANVIAELVTMDKRPPEIDKRDIIMEAVQIMTKCDIETMK